MTEKAYKTPIADLAQKARENYEECCTSSHVWNSLIPTAIDLWEKVETEKELAEQNEARWQNYEKATS